MCLSHHLCGLFQVQPGLTDNSLGVLQLRLELTVFSGDLLEHLRHRGAHTSKRGSKQLGQIRRTNAVTSISALSADLLKILALGAPSLDAVIKGDVRPEERSRGQR